MWPTPQDMHSQLKSAENCTLLQANELCTKEPLDQLKCIAAARCTQDYTKYTLPTPNTLY